LQSEKAPRSYSDIVDIEAAARQIYRRKMLQTGEKQQLSVG
jgi:hypothetical protein